MKTGKDYGGSTIIKVFFLIATLMLIFSFVGCSAYNKAEELFSKGDYSGARELYAESKDNADSADKIKECDYLIAGNYIENEQYKEAKKLLLELSNYKDSSALVKECDYLIADDYIENEQHEEAKKLLSELNDYKDSSTLIKKCNFRLLNSYIKKNGIKGNAGNRIYSLFDDVTVYIENGEDDLFILGCEMENVAARNDLKLYLTCEGGSVYFEGEQSLHFSLLGQEINNTAKGFGTLIPDQKTMVYPTKLVFEKIEESGAVNSSGNSVDLESDLSVLSDKYYGYLISQLPIMLQESGITQRDIGFETPY